MVMDLSVQLMQATVQLEQPLGDGTRTVGTGFLISETTPDGKPHTILVTANHVFDKMPGANARIGYRIANADGFFARCRRRLSAAADIGFLALEPLELDVLRRRELFGTLPRFAADFIDRIGPS